MGRDGVKNLYHAIMEQPYDIQILYDVKVINQRNAEEELNKL